MILLWLTSNYFTLANVRRFCFGKRQTILLWLTSDYFTLANVRRFYFGKRQTILLWLTSDDLLWLTSDDFTLANGRWLYSSKGDVSWGKRLSVRAGNIALLPFDKKCLPVDLLQHTTICYVSLTINQLMSVLHKKSRSYNNILVFPSKSGLAISET